MSNVGVLLGPRVGPFPGRLDPPVLRDFADATKDPSPRLRRGDVAAPGAMVTQLWDAQEASRSAFVPAAFQAAATGGVHGEHDLVVRRQILPGEPLWTWAEGLGARRAGANSRVVIRYTTFDSAGEIVVEQFWTTVWLGVACDDMGRRPPDHSFPQDALPHPVGTWGVDIDHDMAHRYARVSGDWSPHHFDVTAARGSGAEGPFLHGLCTMALCARGVVALAADGDPERLSRIAVRFARPVLIGERLEVRVYDAGPRGYAFEAGSKGATVITHGRAELR